MTTEDPERALPDEDDAGQSAEQIAALREALEQDDAPALRDLTEPLRAPDLADAMALLSGDERVALIDKLGRDFDFEVLSELDETVRDQIVEELPNEQLAKALTTLDSDDALYVLEDMRQHDQDEILAQMPIGDRATLQRALDYPEESAGRLMQSDFIAVAPFWTVGRTIDFMRDTDDLPETFSEIYVVDPAYHLLGTVKLDRLLRTKRPVAINTIMDSEPTSVAVVLDQEEVAARFKRYDLMSAAVTDENERLVGVVTADDIMEVIHDEADEDIKLLAGVGDESVTDNVFYATRSRFPWLFVNLLTAILASAVIKLFDATIEQMVALAVLMPIVASMGGNAGTQTMTIAVRALATKELGPVNGLRIVLRETYVGLINGLLFAIIMASVVLLWLGTGPIAWVIAIAMVFNLVAAALAGILIPMALDRLGQDPAVASGVFVTTVTDVVGFFAFLGLAALVI
ncbi:MAG: magnesium transporter [Pseudomonadota bacterium]